MSGILRGGISFVCREHSSIKHVDHDATGLIPASFSFAISSSTLATYAIARKSSEQNTSVNVSTYVPSHRLVSSEALQPSTSLDAA